VVARAVRSLFQTSLDEMSTSQAIHHIQELQTGRGPKPGRRLDEHMLRALNKLKRPSTAEEITELMNRDLGPDDRPFEAREVASWLRGGHDEVLSLYWLQSRPRR
jgi:hypothetical protein